MQLQPIETLQTLDALKQRYLSQTTAALDGMWLHGFVPAASHYAWSEGEQQRGYFCVNDDGYMLQFFVDPRFRSKEAELFNHVARGESAVGVIKGAIVSTAEPHSLSLCLDHFRTFEVNAVMYQLDASEDERTHSDAASTPLAKVTSSQLPDAVAFAMAEIGAPQDWVTGYYANLIDRGELYGVTDHGRLVATGENRRRDDLLAPHADLGVVVAQSQRGQGFATKILTTLVGMNGREGVRSICSTESDNHAAQKAITRAGFVARNRIVRFDA